MKVSWNWLHEYVPLAMTVAELEHRLAMAGLNHESTQRIGGDVAVDLEITSNRPDCLGHVGVAREISVLWDRPLSVPEPVLPTTGPDITRLTKVSIRCPELCYRYTARVIRGVKIGPSPAWLRDRLTSIGIAVINNVVDVSNYVMMECGQPLHVFDLALLKGPEIIVREAFEAEQFEAIDHRVYPLRPGMCVIADAQRAVALGGVMGGRDSEVSDGTTDLLIESAEFAPLSIRTTARTLGLHSPSSYRFERGVDPVGVDWASRRCCQLILELAGGTPAAGAWDVGRPVTERSPITLRLSQLPRILGVDVPAAEVIKILTALGSRPVENGPDRIVVVPPSWRRDLTREIDLVEEVARIRGYDKIPEAVSVPMAPSHQRDEDRVLKKVRQVLTATGFDEAMTASAVPPAWNQACSPWTNAAPLTCDTPMLKDADALRVSLVPSLLEARRLNESVGNRTIELFEAAHVYLPIDAPLPREQWTLAATTGDDFPLLMGVVESLIESLHIREPLIMAAASLPLLDGQRQCCLQLGDRTLGYVGEVSSEGLKQCGLRAAATVMELDLSVLAAHATLIPWYQELSPYPAIARDINLIVDESVQWSGMQRTIRQAAGPLLESLQFHEVYRDPKKDGPGRKRLLFSINLRSAERTLTNEQADQIRQAIVDACQARHRAELLA
ncbi:MAG: phenylalanine--tRNA ligase subunit beta [Planctomycetes bacterium]|nr:phenylalanine--tRNA ligase subunit beta [Planctomycetota bacterium]